MSAECYSSFFISGHLNVFEQHGDEITLSKSDSHHRMHVTTGTSLNLNDSFI